MVRPRVDEEDFPRVCVRHADMDFRTSLLCAVAGTFLATACAVPGRGDVDDDDESGSDDASLTTTGTGTPSTGTGAGGTGSGGAATTTSSTSGTTSSTSGPSTTSSSTGGATCSYSNLTFNDPVCGGCVETSCCSSLQTCDGSTFCLDFVDCLSLCTDQLCADGCVEAHPTGFSEFDTLNSCMDTMCPTECAAP